MGDISVFLLPHRAVVTRPYQHSGLLMNVYGSGQLVISMVMSVIPSVSLFSCLSVRFPGQFRICTVALYLVSSVSSPHSEVSLFSLLVQP